MGYRIACCVFLTILIFNPLVELNNLNFYGVNIPNEYQYIGLLNQNHCFYLGQYSSFKSIKGFIS